ncbi:Tubulin-specific chaperone E [Dissostichus eleginoides]|uniref:Tubulin-specific chaperone E n=1 Tax=Dissostichus eleginoides TaxID=100907 RepID=A0AAD9C4Q3_DISEL|nr:Tubulin-specific chaperone E [Dissostichus eleginoides]
MTSYILLTAFTWAFKGILCTCRFLWICPYNAIKFLPRERHIKEHTSRQLKQLVGSESKGFAVIPGSPDREGALHKRLTKTEKEILAIKARAACEKASWERRFTQLQRKHEDLCNQLASQAVLVREAGCDEESVGNNGETLEECSRGLSRMKHQHKGSDVSSRGDCEVMEVVQRSSPGFCSPFPHGPGAGSPGQDHAAVGTGQHGNDPLPGPPAGGAELHLGVQLLTPDHGLHDGSHRGHSYFECNPGYGAFVPFHKLLMAWE